MKVILFLILTHFIADFVLQSDRLVTRKNQFYLENQKKISINNPILEHGIIVFTVMQILHLFYKEWYSVLAMTALITLGHLLLDHLKLEYQRKSSRHRFVEFLADQIAHLGIIYLVSSWFVIIYESKYIKIFGNYATSSNQGKWWIPDITSSILGVLIVIIFFSYISGHIISFMLENLRVVKSESETIDGLVVDAVDHLETNVEEIPEKTRHLNEKEMKIGIKIGIIERILVIIFVVVGQYAAMGLILAGKSLARYEELKDKAFSEYYLYGTLISFLFGIVGGLIIKVVIL
ncbi:DUF3307 domain-containing protein [Petrocella sp. FN5]|uniref:DUF3307 domain-containing protein n=1 Tax=Petrocella sp. FN5 TaxID=3032002 RepID=UPI0023DA7452|nr:DUF3307 domain-containing protein [Petrocella sp. FN5]MDF1617567.1 DUF3307 domain-containing protein [Petrocella sp. FN5]